MFLAYLHELKTQKEEREEKVKAAKLERTRQTQIKAQMGGSRYWYEYRVLGQKLKWDEMYPRATGKKVPKAQ